MPSGINKVGINKGQFKKGDMFWKGKKRSKEDKLKMSKPKSKKYINLEIKSECSHCREEYIKVIHNQKWCKICVPDRKSADIMKKYDLSFSDYKNILQMNNGLCEICLKEPATDIDHDHITGKVRGLLCSSCNKGLGFMKDDLNILNGSVEYLKKSTLQNYGK